MDHERVNILLVDDQPAKLLAYEVILKELSENLVVAASGRDALLKLYGGLTQGELTPRPYIHNHVIDLQGNGRATGRCYVELRNLKKDMEWVGSGYYEDEYAKTGDEWKFKSRTFRTAYMSVNPG